MTSKFTFTSSRLGKHILNGTHVMTASETFAMLQWQEAELTRYRTALAEITRYADRAVAEDAPQTDVDLLHESIRDARTLLYGLLHGE